MFALIIPLGGNIPGLGVGNELPGGWPGHPAHPLPPSPGHPAHPLPEVPPGVTLPANPPEIGNSLPIPPGQVGTLPIVPGQIWPPIQGGSGQVLALVAVQGYGHRWALIDLSSVPTPR